MIFEEPAHAILIDLSRSDGHNELVEMCFFRLDHEAVFHQENTGGHDSDPLIAIQKRMISRQSKKIGRREIADVVAAMASFVDGSV